MVGIETSRRTVVAGGMLALAAPRLLLARSPMAGPVVVDTACGKLRGLRDARGDRFLGVPYAADTGGSNRFMAPRPVQPWRGEREALAFGQRAPQSRRGEQPQAGGGTARYGEDCCVLNVYTLAANARATRPVMLFIHGGGFRSGSGDSPIMDGAALAAFGDVVVVTVNRRLNVLGFANLGHVDPDFADAANAGQLDLIAALHWVQDNIGQFGGDRRRVLVFGHSGGGSSVETLALMPAADNLFHRAVNLSGTSGFAMTSAQEAAPAADRFLADLGIGRGDLRKLQDLPYDTLANAYDAAFRAVGSGDYRPVVDGRHIPAGPLAAGGLVRATRLPFIMNCTSTEASAWLAQDRRNVTVDLAQVKRRIGAQFGLDDAASSRIVDAYRVQDPARTPWSILVAVASDALVRKPMRIAAQAKAAQARAPVRFGEFAWRSPADGGIWGGPHGIEVAFAFGNQEQGRLSAGAGPAGAVTARNFMSALVAFARSGSPDHGATVGWRPYAQPARPTMVIDQRCGLVDDYRKADRVAADLLPDQDAFKLVSGPLFRFET